MKNIVRLVSIIGFLLTWEFQLSEMIVNGQTVATQKSSFNEELYLLANPDVSDLIKQGKYKSGLDHYNQVGQTAIKPDGEHYGSFFTGTSGNDTVVGQGVGEHAHFAGVDFEIVSGTDDPFPLRPKSIGKGEIDVLVGTKEGSNEFLLGSFITAVNPKAECFYIGQGNVDFATIQNFTKSKDVIVLAGKPDQYQWQSTGGNIRISTTSGDLVAIVEGIDKLEVGEIYEEAGVFSLK